MRRPGWPSARCRPRATRARPAIDTRWWSTWTPTPWPPRTGDPRQPSPPRPSDGNGGAGDGRRRRDEAGGIHLSVATARRLACDVSKVTMRHVHVGEVLRVGRRPRTVSPALRRPLAARDGRCRFPGCTATRSDPQTRAALRARWGDGARQSGAPLPVAMRVAQVIHIVRRDELAPHPYRMPVPIGPDVDCGRVPRTR